MWCFMCLCGDVSTAYVVLYLLPMWCCIYCLCGVVSTAYVVLYVPMWCCMCLCCVVSTAYVVLYLLPMLCCIYCLCGAVSTAYVVWYLLPMWCCMCLCGVVSTAYVVWHRVINAGVLRGCCLCCVRRVCVPILHGTEQHMHVLECGRCLLCAVLCLYDHMCGTEQQTCFW